MKKENKICGILCFIGLIFILTGCAPKRLTEKEIVAKLPEEITQVMVDDEILQMEITDFEIEKRKIDRETKTDSVWAIVTLSNHYYEFKKYVTLTYSYYDVKGGWQLDSTWEDNAKMEYKVKRNPINESEVLVKPEGVMYNLTLKECKEDLKNNTVVYICEALAEKEYYTKNWLRKVTYYFDGYHWIQEEQLDEENIEWDIVGEYYLATEEYGCDFYMNITDFDAENGKVSGFCSFVYDYPAAYTHEAVSYDLTDTVVEVNDNDLSILIDNVGKYGQTYIYFDYGTAIATYDRYWKCRIGRITSAENYAKPPFTVWGNGLESDYKNIAVLGVDSINGGGLLGNSRSNVNAVLSINQTTGDIRIVNISNITYLFIEDSYSQIRNAYAWGGPSDAIEALNTNLDMDITDIIVFNSDALIELVDGMGGIWVDIDEKTMSSMNHYQIYYSDYMKENWTNVESTGFQRINGVQAAAYCLMKPETKNIDWLERQQNTFMAIIEQMKTMDVAELDLLLQLLSNKIYISFDEKELMNLKDALVEGNLTGAELFPKEELGKGLVLGAKGSCLCPTTLEECVKQLHEFLFGKSNYSPSDKVKQISSQIQSDITPYLDKE